MSAAVSVAPSPAFDHALSHVLVSEGGYSADPNDPGGETNLGITAATLETARAQGIVPQETDVRGLTLEQARVIYHSLYWLPIRGDELPQALAVALFDGAVNMGLSSAVMGLQAALGVRVDGIVGPTTVAAAQRRGINALDGMLASRAARYADLCASRPALLRYRHGWLKRCFRVARLASALGVAVALSGCTAFVELHPWGKPPDVTSPRPAPEVCRATPDGVVCVPAGVLPPSPAPGGDK